MTESFVPREDAEHTQVNLTVASDIPMPPAPLNQSAEHAQIPLPRKHIPVSYVTAKPPPRRSWAWVIVLVLFVALFGVVGVGALAYWGAQTPAITPQPIDRSNLPTPVDARIAYAGATAVPPTASRLVPTLAAPTAAPVLEVEGYSAWNGTSRLTVLIMGLDRRPGYTGLAYRTDTMMLVSIDPATNSVGVLSIPRDLYVNVPGYAALQRINTPMVLGEYEEAGYGPQLALETVQYNFGIRIHHTIVVDFEAVITLVDAIGGIDVDVPHPIADYAFPDMGDGYDPLVLQAGLQHMDGLTALKYARTRHGDSDFQRAERQQQVLFAVREQVTSRNALSGLILRAPALYGSLSEDIYTDLSLDEIIQLGLYLSELPVENIRTGVIGVDYVMGYTTEDGAQVLVPNRALLADLFADVFGATYGE